MMLKKALIKLGDNQIEITSDCLWSSFNLFQI